MKNPLIFITLALLFSITDAVALPEQMQVTVPRPDNGNNVTLVLTRYSIRDPNFFEVYEDENTYPSSAHLNGADPDNFTQYNTANLPVRTYRGHVAEEPNSTVMAVVWPGNQTFTAAIQEGKRILWNVDDLNIQIANNDVVTTTPGQSFRSTINNKSQDWVPTFGNAPTDLSNVDLLATTPATPKHGWDLNPDTSNGIKRVQIAFDAEPEWFAQRAGSSMEKALAMIEHSVNVLDLVYVRDLSMSHVLTAYIQRTDTTLHVDSKDLRKTWKENGLGSNPGANGGSNSIPYQQVVWAFVNEGNPSAFENKQPLSGGNFCRVPVKDDDPGGISHEIGHNWGGSHFIYPRDSMSGGGPWFGPTTVQRMIFLRDDANVGGGLPTITNNQYNWNVHPYAMPDLARINQNQTTDINVLGNDYDGNGDSIGIAQFQSVSEKGGTIFQVNNKLRYTPPQGFQGRDSFTYLVTDGEYTNDAFVQIDVGGDLLIHYDFESLNTSQVRPIRDASGSNLHGKLVNFDGKGRLVNGISGKALRFPTLIDSSTVDDDSVRPFIDIGDVVDPFDGEHSVAMWVKLKPEAFNYNQPIYLFSNSSSVIDTLVSGYNLSIDKTGTTFRFQLREQLTSNNQTELPPLRNITYTIPGGILSNTWYHIAFTMNRTQNRIRAYVNGEVVVPVAGNDINIEPNSFIKGKPEGGRYIASGLGINTYKPKKFTPFIGVMDEVRIYGRKLTTSEVKGLYDNP